MSLLSRWVAWSSTESRANTRFQRTGRAYTALSTRMGRLLESLTIANDEGRLLRKLDGSARIDLLILENCGVTSISAGQRRDLLEILEDRYERCSTLVTSQLPVKKWHEWIGDPTLADAILGRRVHNAHRFELSGESLRKTRAGSLAGSTERRARRINRDLRSEGFRKPGSGDDFQ